MNAFLRLLPQIFSSQSVKGKKRWLAVLLSLLSAYQLLSPNGIGAEWGVPSYDTFYKEPRDILISRVEAASDAQKNGVEEFRSALQQFKDVTDFDGGELEIKFTKLSTAFHDSEDAAAQVSSRISRVVSATNRLLDGWSDELKQYHDPAIKRKAEDQFDQTRLQAERLIASMRKTESKTVPVLAAFKDQVLFLKHNLNMQAIGSAQAQSVAIENDVNELIDEMEASINQAREFIGQLDS